MQKTLVALALVGAALCLPIAPAQAQATRTWVSGVGDDANPCSRTAPCKTWAGAISKTTAGGEIDALDPGGFGGVTLTKSITLDGGGGQVASVLVAGTNGINISAGATDVIIIKNLRLQGLLGNGSSSSSAGITAIQISSAAMVVIENVEIYGFNTHGINDIRTTGGKLAIRNTTVFNVASTGIRINGGAGAARIDASIETSGVSFAGTGITAANGPHVTVKNTTVSDILTNALDVETSGTQLNFDNGMLSNSATGLLTAGGSALFLSNTDMVNNTTGASGTWTSYGNNRLLNNGSAGTGPSPAGGAVSNLGEQ
jgi:hypothetical protein